MRARGARVVIDEYADAFVSDRADFRGVAVGHALDHRNYAGQRKIYKFNCLSASYKTLP
jgi:hypothetical protein